MAETTCGLCYNYCWQRESQSGQHSVWLRLLVGCVTTSAGRESHNQVSIQCGWDYLWVVLQLLLAERVKSGQHSVWLRLLVGCLTTSASRERERGRVMIRAVFSMAETALRLCCNFIWQSHDQVSIQYRVWLRLLLGCLTTSAGRERVWGSVMIRPVFSMVCGTLGLCNTD